MSKKTLSLKAPLVSFCSEELKKVVAAGEAIPESLTEEHGRVKEFFGTEDLTTVGEFKISIENLLWSLFEKIKVPESPLRLKAHERFLQEVASKLRETLETEELPTLSVSSLKQIVHYVEDPEEFTKLTFPFEYKVSEETTRALPLPSINILSSEAFVDMLDQIFAPTKE